MLSRLVMMFFDKEYLALTSGPSFVDDVNMVMVPVEQGTVYKEGGLVTEVGGGEEFSDSRTARICREIADTVMPRSVKMEEDSPSKHSGGKIPILDMEMWVSR